MRKALSRSYSFDISTGLVFGKNAATDLENFGVNPKEYLDAGIETITQFFPMESIAKYGIGELKVVGYSEYLNSRPSKSLETCMYQQL